MARRLYQADWGGAGYVPLDVKWGMQGEYATPAVQECVLFGMAHMTAKEVESFLKKSSLFHPSEQAIKNLVNKSGAFVEAHRDELHTAIREEETIPEETEIVVASIDGVNVLLRESGRRCGRPRERPGEVQGGEQASGYKNAMLGSISFYRREVTEKDGIKPVRIKSRYVARMPESCYPTFKEQFEAELDHVEQAIDKHTVKVLLNDGHRSLWYYIDHNERFDSYEKLVDFYHTSEHLSWAAEAIFGKNSPAAKAWYEKWYDKLLTQKKAATGVIRSMEYYANTLNLPKGRQKEIRKQQTFFRRNAHRMNYADFLKRGLPIGSGPVEAACKSVVKGRMCRSGMRWSRKGGQKILNLRVYAKSDRWESFWNNYIQLKQAA